LGLGTNFRDFALNNGMGHAIIEESWRRTWCGSYMVVGILASLTSIGGTFGLQHVQFFVRLPCEHFDCVQCRTLPPLRLQGEFLEQTFADGTHKYSFLVYKLEWFQP